MSLSDHVTDDSQRRAMGATSQQFRNQ